MLKLLSQLFRTKEPPPFDIEKAVGHYLLTLPRCTARILVVSRRYLDERYNYELTVDAPDLAAWAKGHAKGAWSSDRSEQAACLALPLWLRLADLSDDTATLLPKKMFDICREYHSDFRKLPGSQIYCNECGEPIEDVIEQYFQRPQKGIFDIREFEMRCPNGHLLYREKIGIHTHVSPIEVPDFLKQR